ncbi:MAG: hypothetical protein ACYC1S_15540 [Gemmatimonadaceae bacterium]
MLRLAATALLLASLGCHSAEQVCTLLPCPNGLTVTVANTPAGQVVVRATVPGSTNEYVAECSGGSVCSVYFSDFTPPSVTLVVTAGGTTRTQTVAPVYTTRQPNGPNCGTCRNATVAIVW